MTYPRMDLQSLPHWETDTRVGTDDVERQIQLAYWQFIAMLQAAKAISDGSQYPETVVNAEEETAFDTAVTNLLTDLTAAGVHFDEIFALVP